MMLQTNDAQTSDNNKRMMWQTNEQWQANNVTN